MAQIMIIVFHALKKNFELWKFHHAFVLVDILNTIHSANNVMIYGIQS